MPMVEVGPRELLTRVTRELAQGMEVTHRTLPEGNGPRAAVLRGFSPGGVLLHHRSESQQRNRSGGFYSTSQGADPPQTGR